MFNNMFGRLVALFIVVILLFTVLGGAISVFSTRKAMIEDRMNALMTEAREIAALASLYSDTTLYRNNAELEFLQYKAEKVYSEYDAYILIVDASGRVMDNFATASQDGSKSLETLNTDQIMETLEEVAEGKEVQTTLTSADGPIFTVAVPWSEDGTVKGVVLIHTSSQYIQSEYRHFVIQVALGLLMVALMAFVGLSLYTRGIINPLTSITHAAEEMSRGNLSVRAKIVGVNEVKQLAGSFNVMAEKLERNEESRKEFVANVSHELRSPVTSIHGFVEGMLDGTIPPEEARPYLQIVFDETNRMKRLISDLLQLSRMDKGMEQLNLSPFDLHELIRRIVIERMADIEKKQIELELNFFQEDCPVYADADRIAQVIHNIVDNALKYLSENGHLTFTTVLLQNRIVSVTIQNDGEPIAPEDRPHIFDRFYKAEKAHTSGKGTGLGLSISKQIMELHGQTLELADVPEGVGFRFTLPMTEKGDKARLNPA